MWSHHHKCGTLSSAIQICSVGLASVTITVSPPGSVSARRWAGAMFNSGAHCSHKKAKLWQVFLSLSLPLPLKLLSAPVSLFNLSFTLDVTALSQNGGPKSSGWSTVIDAAIRTATVYSSTLFTHATAADQLGARTPCLSFQNQLKVLLLAPTLRQETLNFQE